MKHFFDKFEKYLSRLSDRVFRPLRGGHEIPPASAIFLHKYSSFQIAQDNQEWKNLIRGNNAYLHCVSSTQLVLSPPALSIRTEATCFALLMNEAHKRKLFENVGRNAKIIATLADVIQLVLA